MALLLFVAAPLFCFLLWRGMITLPSAYDDYNPWADLDIAAKPNFLTGYKLLRLSFDSTACYAALARAGIPTTRLPDTRRSDGCGIKDGGHFKHATTSFTGTCPLSVAWALFELHELQPLAETHYGEKVIGSTHLGTYACRNIGAGSRRSQHATANAIDIAGFTLQSGKRIMLINGWRHETHGAFLRAAQNGACRFFRGVLGPDYNAAHHDHFHMETGRFMMCR